MAETLASFWLSLAWPLTVQVGVLIAVMLLLSLALARVAPRYRYALWMLVLLRLMLPVPLESPLGVLGRSRPAWTQPRVAAADRPAVTSVSATATRAAEPLATGSVNRRGTRSLAAALPLVWLAGIAGFLLLTGRRWLGLSRLTRSLHEVNRAELLELLARLAAELVKGRRVRLLEATDADSLGAPALVGLARPAVVLPAVMARAWSLEQLEPVLRHELTHLARHDNLVNAMQVLVQAAYFFHPLVWLANRQLRLERELACDDEVVRQARGERRGYVASILAAAEASSAPRQGLAALAMAEWASGLARRVTRMLDGGYRVVRDRGMLAFAPVLILGVLAVAAAGQRPTPPPEAEPADIARRPLEGKIRSYFKFRGVLEGPDRTLVPLTRDVRLPRLLRQADVLYPPDALAERLGGLVRLDGVVDERGAVSELSVALSGDPRLARASQELAAGSTFEPGRTAGGDAVPVAIRFSCSFDFVHPRRRVAAPTPHPGWQDELRATYGLEPGQALKLVQPPFSPSRTDAYWAMSRTQAEAIPEGADRIVFTWRPDTRRLELNACVFGAESLGDLVSFLGVKRFQVRGEQALLKTPVAGDLVLRDGARLDAYVKALEAELDAKPGLRLRLEVAEVPWPTWVATGTFRPSPLPEAQAFDEVEVFRKTLDEDASTAEGGRAGLRSFLEEYLAWVLDAPVVCEVAGADEVELSFRVHRDAVGIGNAEPVLANVTAQTGIVFTRAERPVKVVHVGRL